MVVARSLASWAGLGEEPPRVVSEATLLEESHGSMQTHSALSQRMKMSDERGMKTSICHPWERGDEMTLKGEETMWKLKYINCIVN